MLYERAMRIWRNEVIFTAIFEPLYFFFPGGAREASRRRRARGGAGVGDIFDSTYRVLFPRGVRYKAKNEEEKRVIWKKYDDFAASAIPSLHKMNQVCLLLHIYDYAVSDIVVF